MLSKMTFVVCFLFCLPLAAQSLEEMARTPAPDPARETLCQLDGSAARNIADMRKKGISEEMAMQYVIDKNLGIDTVFAWITLIHFVYNRAASAPTEDFRFAALILCRRGTGTKRDYQ